MDVEEKRLEFDLAAFGSLGLESIFGALRSLFSAEDCAEILGRGRTRFGISENPLKIGNEANLTLFDPDLEYVETKDMLHSTSSNSMYLNTQLKGKAYGIIVGKKTNL
jgi:dihydroorotase